MLNFFRKKISPNNPLRLFWHKQRAVLAAIRHEFPGGGMVVIGVTGTNGKTTTTHIIEHLLRTAKRKVAMMSTVEMRINGEVRPNTTKKTTLSPFKVQRFLSECYQRGIQYVVIEASSHALHQQRLWGIPFSISVITNITHEHLDYHGTMEKYRDAKKVLFESVAKTCQRDLPPVLDRIPHEQAMVLNTADRYFEDFNALACPAKYTYGFEKGTLRALDVRYRKAGSRFSLKYKNHSVPIELHVPGSFNVENAMAAAGAALACRLSLSEIREGLNTFEGVGGRMERISSPKGFEVLVDFALTPDALERLYSTLRQTKPARLIGIIGSCGDRDREKRPVMGEIVGRHTDVTIVTDEEPYTEDPMAIIEAVYEGAKSVQNTDYLHLIADRYEAIEFAIQNARPGDLIVVTGMGNLPTRTLNSGPIEWDEREVVREIIKKYCS